MKRTIYLFVSMGVSMAGFAQQANTELKSLINQSFTYYPRFRELEQAVTINEQRAELAATALKPNIGAVANYTYTAPVPKIPFPDGNGNTKTVQLSPNHNINTGINILEPLYDFGKTRLSIERARQDVQQSKNNIEYNKAQLAAQVATVYYTIIYLQKAIALQDSVMAVLELNRKQMENKYKNGEALKLDVLTMQNNIDIEQNRKVDLQNQLQKQLNLLAYATGNAALPLNTELSFNPVMVSDSDALHAAQDGNIEYTIARDRIRQSETDLAITKLGNRPSINLNGATGFRNGFQPDISAFKFNYALGVGLSVPLYSGGRIKKQVQLAQSAVKQNQLALESLDNEYRRNIEQALTDVRSNQERLTTVHEQISIAREALKVAQSRYTNGISTNIELLNANTNLQRVELARLQYEYQLALAEVELARLMGVRYW